MTGQTDFRGALLDAARPVPEGLTDGAGRPAGQRYSVYRNNVAVSLREALETGFPAVRSLIGDQNFAHVAGAYLRVSPPVSPLMMHYGAGFPDYLAQQDPLRKWGYLPDVARLELALRQSYHAADAPALDPAALAALDEPALLAARLTMAQALRLVPSAWPVVSVWRFATHPGQPKPQARAEHALILRPDFDPQVFALAPADAAFVAALLNGHSFGDAVEAAGDALNLGDTLNLLLTHGGIAALT